MSISRGKALVKMVLNGNENKNRTLTSSDNVSVNRCSNDEYKDSATTIFENKQYISKISLDSTNLTSVQNIVIEESYGNVSAAVLNSMKTFSMLKLKTCQQISVMAVILIPDVIQWNVMAVKIVTSMTLRNIFLKMRPEERILAKETVTRIFQIIQNYLTTKTVTIMMLYH